MFKDNLLELRKLHNMSQEAEKINKPRNFHTKLLRHKAPRRV